MPQPQLADPIAPPSPAPASVPLPRGSIGSTLAGLLRSARPGQWIKNLLVLVAPVAAGQLRAPGTVIEVVFAVCAFTVTSSGIYMLNDVLDRQADALHPVKCHRPIASGQVTPRTAATIGVLLLALPVSTLALTGRLAVGTTLAAFVLVNGGYSLAFKHHAYADVAGVSLSHLLRALGGAAAGSVALHPLLGVVIFAAALHLIASKRFAELRDVGSRRGTRPVLRAYTRRNLDLIRSVSAAVALGACTMWAVEHSARSGGPWYILTLIPVIIGYLRFETAVSDGAGERPERLLVSDTRLRTAALCAVTVLGFASHLS